jgi:hypothetical protein
MIIEKAGEPGQQYNREHRCVAHEKIVTLTGEGKINLGTEKIDFLLVPELKHPEVSLLTNLRVSGTVMNPQVSPDKISLLTKGAEALSSLAVGPIGLLAPFVHLGAHNAHPCNIQSAGQSGLPAPPAK